MKAKVAVVAMVVIVAIVAFFSLSINIVGQGFKADHYGRLEVIPLVGTTGPESLAFDANGGGPYTGVSGGRILKWEREHRRWVQFAASPGSLSKKCREGSQIDPNLEPICGRPLGLQFNKKTGELYVADAYMGLLRVPPNGTIAVPVATQAQGLPFRFTNGVDIDEDSGLVYFTDSSAKFQRSEYQKVIDTGDRTGRLLKYDPKTKQVELLLDGLLFPNGVAISSDKSFLFIVETTTCRILKYDLRRPNPNPVKVVTYLYGRPDNIKRSVRGGFWVALPSGSGRLLRPNLLLMQLLPRVSELLARNSLVDVLGLMATGLQRGEALAVRLSDEGKIIEVEGFGGRTMWPITEVEEHTAGILWLGSVFVPFVGVFEL